MGIRLDKHDLTMYAANVTPYFDQYPERRTSTERAIVELERGRSVPVSERGRATGTTMRLKAGRYVEECVNE